jgi:hypothetical protein
MLSFNFVDDLEILMLLNLHFTKQKHMEILSLGSRETESVKAHRCTGAAGAQQEAAHGPHA